MAAGVLPVGTHAKGGFTVCGDGEDALDEAFGIAGGVDVSGFAVGDVLGLAAFRGGDHREADDAGFLDGVGRGIGAGGVDEAPCAREGGESLGARAVAEEADVRRAAALGELGVFGSVDFEIDPGETGIGEGGEEGIDSFQAGEGAEENGGGSRKGRCTTRWREDALDFEAGGVGSVFEEVDAGMGCEVAEFFRAPW